MFFVLSGPFGERDEEQVFIQRVIPETDRIFVRLSSNGRRQVHKHSALTQIYVYIYMHVYTSDTHTHTTYHTDFASFDGVHLYGCCISNGP